jgi:hypothetical protein
MANLPANNDMTGSAVTQGGFKARLNDVLDFLRDILGSTGTPASARTALGLGALATKSDVAAADIATGAVTADKIGTGAVTEAKLGAAAVTAAKIADGAVGTGKVAAGAITDGLLAANAVTTGKVNDAAITSAKIANASVTAPKLAASAVGTAAIADGAVTPAKLSATAISMQVVAEANITSAVAQVDLTLPGGWSMFLLTVADLRPSATASFRLRTSNDGVTFQSGASDYANVESGAPVNAAFVTLASFAAATDNAAPVAQFTIYPGAPTTPRFSVVGTAGTLDASSGAAAVAAYMGGRNAAGRQQAIRLFMSSGNINRATIRLIGVA